MNTLAPALTQEATNPQGFQQSDLNDMNSAALQSLGGSQAAAVGAGGVRAARTRNAGAGDAAIGESSREAMRDLSQRALQVSTANATMREQKRQQALNQLQGLYGQNVGSSLQSLGLSNDALNVANGADRNLMGFYGDIMKTASGLIDPFGQQAAKNIGSGGSNG